MKKSVTSIGLSIMLAPLVAIGASTTFRLSINHGGVRASTGEETLRFSNLWEGDANATVTIAQDGVVLAEGLTGEGEQNWSVSRNGTYALTHTTYTNGVVAKVENATFVVTGKDVPFLPEDIVTTGYNDQYDGQGHGISVTAPEGAVVRYARDADGPYGAKPSFTNACGATTVWYEVTKEGYIPYTNSATVAIVPRPVTLTSGTKTDFVYDGQPHGFQVLNVGGAGFVAGEGVATSNWATVTTEAEGEVANTFDFAPLDGTKLSNYDIAVVTGRIAVVKATVGGGTGDEPGEGTIPVGGLSKFDVTEVYDGKGHTIDTNAVVAAFAEATGGSVNIVYALDDGTGTDGNPGQPVLPWGAIAPTLTNAGSVVVWYKVASANYEDFVHAAKVTVTKRPVTLTSGTQSWPYDTLAHSNMTVTVGGSGFAEGEGFAAFGFPTITEVGTLPNAFDYTLQLKAGSVADNYAITTVLGTLAVDEAYKPIFIRCEWQDDVVVPDSADFRIFANGKTLQDMTVTAAMGWTNSVPVKVYKDGVPIVYSIEPLPSSGVRYETTGYGCSPLLSLPFSSLVLCRNGWATLLETPFGSEIYGIEGWKEFGSCRFNVFVATQSTLAGELFRVDGYSGTFDIDDGTGGEGGVTSLFSFAGTYDGQGHGIAVSVVDPPAGMTIRYARGNGATMPSAGWSSANPLFTNVCAQVAVWYAVECAGYTSYTNWATVTITPKRLTTDSIWLVYPAEGRFVYTGEAQEPEVAAADGNPSIITDDDWEVSFANNVNAGTATATFTGKRNYTSTCTEDFEIEKATIGGGTGDEPGEGTIPAGGLSKFDATDIYDGKGHTIDTNALVAAFAARLGAESFEVTYAVNGTAEEEPGQPVLPWAESPMAYTNAGEYVVWYRVASANYEDFVHAAKVTVTKRPVTFVSASASKAYDTTPLRRDVVTVKPGTSGFADGEGFTATCSGTITAVGSTANAFSYTLAPNTQASNYTISTEYGTLTVTKGTLDPSEVLGEGGAGTDEQPRLCARVYNGEAQGLLVEPNLREPYTILYALAPPDFGATSPTRTNVADGDLKIHFRLVTDNYDPLDGVAILRIVPRTVTAEMLAYSDDAFFFDGADTKVPDVILVDTNALGVIISTANDYTRTYGERLATGEYPVTITGANNYAGAVTKAFAVLKRPVAPPVIPAKSYNGRTQKPTIPGDARWTVVANPGGVDARLYTNVVLRLTNAEDYRWKPLGEDETDWTGVFEIKKAANGWSTYPGIKSWTNGVETASEPVGRARYGTVLVAYRRAGTDVAAETSVKPATPGRYIARFWVEPTDNYAGYALTVHYEVAFEIFAGPDDPAGGDATATTPVPVPYVWLDPYLRQYGGDYETAAHATGRNGVALWASYVAGLDPEDPASRFRARIAIGADGLPVVTWEPDLSRDTPPRTYTIYGKADLDATGEWVPVTDANKSRMRFFKVVVDL